MVVETAVAGTAAVTAAVAAAGTVVVGKAAAVEHAVVGIVVVDTKDFVEFGAAVGRAVVKTADERHRMMVAQLDSNL